MADVTFTEMSAVESPKEDEAASPEQPKKSKAKPTAPKGKQPAARATSKSPAKITASQSPLLAPLKSPKQSKSLKAAKPQNPTMLKMVLEALQNNKSVKGLTLQGMKRYITETYPHLKENFSNARFRQALIKGQENNEIVRPKSSEETGLKGYFLLNRALYSQKDKKEPKTKKSADSEDKVKQPGKVARKTKPALNTSGSAKTAAAKPKTASKLTKSKSEPKAASAKSAATKTSTKGAVTKKTSKAAVPKKASTKAAATTAVTKAAVKKSLKATSTPKSQASKPIMATPKLSKSATAGPRMKTAAVKRLVKRMD